MQQRSPLPLDKVNRSSRAGKAQNGPVGRHGPPSYTHGFLVSLSCCEKTRLMDNPIATPTCANVPSALESKRKLNRVFGAADGPRGL
ncbi:hypothetical protein A4X09_0g1136 [Tilletia walkeri]|uniref:Uncharacterized protein n=1 Tax=Tilletia walkeri TaxID=117179 RepID=A0A8X7T6Z5_9BASI|nr:hypothetical protein A4X09_0g1136 [Tilletia walkeri]